MKKVAFFAGIVLGLMTMASCGDSTTTDEINEQNNEESNETVQLSEEYEAYMTQLDANDTMDIANSLYYVNGNQEGVEVALFLDGEGEIQKIEETMISPTGSVTSNLFYYKDGAKYATKQFVEQIAGDSVYFEEYRSYYNKDESVKLTKKRSAAYEEMLEYESFTVTDNKDCKADRAMRIVNQEGEFETTFQGFVELEGFLFLVVGENKKSGYASSLIVQQYTPDILELKAKESEMIGTPLEVQFMIDHNQGEQQILIGARIIRGSAKN